MTWLGLWFVAATASAPTERATVADEIAAIARDLPVLAPMPESLVVVVVADGHIVKLSAERRLPESWQAAFRRYEPYQPGETSLSARSERVSVVPTTLTVHGEGNTHAAAALFDAALARLSTCRFADERERRIDAVHAQVVVGAGGEVLATEIEGPFAECMKTLLGQVHLPALAGQTLAVDFSLDCGPARVVLERRADGSGRLDEKDIKRVIQGARKAIRACHEAALVRDPHIGGTVHLRFLVEKDGHVSSPSIDATTMNDAEVEKCLTEVVGALQFPPPAGGVVIVNYPFSFRAAL